MHPILFLINQVMIPAITYFHDALPLHNYGLSIVCLTLAVKFALFPLAQRQFSNMRQMQRLQPLMKALQDELKAKQAEARDSAAKLAVQQEFQAKMTAFYKEHNANPASGCVTMIVQLPILWALYGSLRSPAMIEAIKSAPPVQQGFLFISNMLNQGVIQKLPTGASVFHWDNLILIVLYSATSYVTQRMMTTNPKDPMQRQMLLMGPLMGPLIGWALPSGLLLYFVVSGLFTVVQYSILLRRFPLVAPLAAPGGTLTVTSTTVVDDTPSTPTITETSQNGGQVPSRKNRR